MNRRDALLALLAFGTAAAPLPTKAQRQSKTFRIGFLGGAGGPPNGLPPAALREGLSALGYVEGTNVAYEGRWAEGKLGHLPALAAELVQLHVDVIVVLGWLATQAVKQATSVIPT